MKKAIKVVAINILLFMLILMSINILLVGLFQGYQAYKMARKPQSGAMLYKCAGLPNYQGIDWAETHFIEVEQLESEYRSYIGWRRLAYKGKTITINDNGIRMTPGNSRMSPGNTRSVVFLGGSTMWGEGSDDRTTIPAYFSKLSENNHVLNLGEAGYNAFQSTLFLQLQMIQGLKPDIVVTYDGVNECSWARSRSPMAHNRENQIIKILKGQDRMKAPPV